MSKKREKGKPEASTDKEADEDCGVCAAANPGASTDEGSRSWNPFSFLAGTERTQQTKDHTREAGLQVIADNIARNGTHYDKVVLHSYYHGQMQREDAEESGLLCCDGDFLVRESCNSLLPIVVTIRWLHNGHTYWHQEVNFNEKKSCWSMGGKCMKSLPELLQDYVKSGRKVGKMRAVLKYPIPRPAYVIDVERLKKKEQVGRGRFGKVHLGELYRSADDQENCEKVAIKEISMQGSAKAEELETAFKEAKQDFLREVRLMKDFKHPNVVRFLGVQHLRNPIQIVMEFVPYGSLDNYLKTNFEEIQSSRLLQFCVDAAMGLAYLKERKCVHCDIAARNCLVSESECVKISDFGLAKRAFLKKVKVGEHEVVPIPWCSPETLTKGEWSHQSDVWMFGVLMWEIYNKAQIPYGGVRAQDIQAHVKAFKVGNHLGKKPGSRCSKCTRQVMCHCFAFEPKDRITIEKAVQDLEGCQGLEKVTAKSEAKKGMEKVTAKSEAKKGDGRHRVKRSQEPKLKKATKDLSS